MKRILLSFVALFIVVACRAQGVVNNLVVFINESEPFTLIMNGERYNMSPQTKVRVTGLTLKKYQVKIVFENTKLKDINTTLTFFNSGYECEFALNKRGKKKHTMDYFTEKRIEGFDQVNNQSTADQSTNQTTSNVPPRQNSGEIDNEIKTVNTPTKSSTPTNTALTGTGTFPKQNIPKTADSKCETPLSQEQFEKYKGEIMKKTSDNDKKILAFTLIESHCLLTGQVKQLMDSFVEDNVKLEVAKKAYDITKDYSNYSKLTDAFLNNGVKDEFKKFLSVRK